MMPFAPQRGNVRNGAHLTLQLEQGLGNPGLLKQGAGLREPQAGLWGRRLAGCTLQWHPWVDVTQVWSLARKVA